MKAARARTGGASSFLADRVERRGAVRLLNTQRVSAYCQRIRGLAVDYDWPRYGYAPFRACMRQRAAEGAEGELAVLRQPARKRFPLSGGELAALREEGLLSRIDLSHSHAIKIAYQDKLHEQGAEAQWRWINDGAVCLRRRGRMAADVGIAGSRWLNSAVCGPRIGR